VAGYTENGRVVAPTTDFAGAYAHATGRAPFKLPATWLAAELAVDPHAQLNFASTDDIIGGNSGSPVIGRNGEVIGVIFDGNIQSLGGDYGYDAAVNRAVAVDVTGIIEALKHIYHADRVVNELQP
jgi:S1-C subfamily serine protease